MNRRRWIVLALIFLGILVSYIDRGNLSIAAQSMMHDLHLDPQIMGGLFSAFFATYAICQIPAGLVVDRFGVRGVYALAFGVWSLASASIALCRGPGDVLASRLALGVAESIGPIASLAFIRANFSERENGVPVAVYISGQTLGPACGTILGAALLSQFGWRTMFAVTGLAALIWIPAWLWLAPRGRLESSQKTDLPSAPWPWKDIFMNPTVWAMTGSIFFTSYYWNFVLSWIPTYLTMSRGFTTMGMGRILSVPLAIMAVTNLATGFIADRLLKKTGSLFWVRVSLGAAGMLGSSSIVLLNFTSEKMVLPILLVSVCSFGTASANFWTISQNAAPPDKVGRVIGYFNTVAQLAGAAAPMVTAWTLGPHMSFRFAISLAACAPILAAVLLIVAGFGLEDFRRKLSGESPALTKLSL